MRRIILSACLCITAILASAQITINGSKFVQIQKVIGIDTITVLLINDVSTADITYTGNGTTINWYKYSKGVNTFNSSFKTIYPEDATGYSLNVDGHETHIWVIDYKNYLPVFNSFEPENNPNSQCVNMNLLIDAKVPALSYQSFIGSQFSLQRNFSITYQTLKWDDTTNTWITDNITVPLELPAPQINVLTPYGNTTFTITGDQYASELGLTPVSKTSLQYVTSAVICHLKTSVTSRDQNTGNNNEGDFPSSKTPINFSAPIDVQFLSHANEPTTQFYNWGIYKDSKLVITRSEKDTRNSFTEAGTYKVRLSVSNSKCIYTDSITVIVSESAIYVPNVFTPNGDGLNDEFRVAYKSLLSFQCWVYNRWGRQVYYWADPSKGWDGNIGGKKATPGPYFYVIKATGSDKKIYKLKGDINLLRGTGN